MSFHRLLLNLVHWCIRLLLEIHSTFILLKQSLFKILVNRQKDLPLAISAGTLKKLPRHLALCIAEDDISFSDVASIVVWALACRISTISIYDHEGIIQKNSEKLKTSIVEKKKLLCVETPFFSEESKTNCKTNGFTNGCQSDPKLRLSLLSSKDGRQDIVLTARKLIDQVKRKVLTTSDITIELLGDSLNANRNLPYPDLLLCCGSTYSTVGFLPWHIHLTEILRLKTHHHITVETFHSHLLRFANCEQRFGR